MKIERKRFAEQESMEWRNDCLQKNVPEKEAVMFTGIVEETGTIKKIEKGTSSGRLTIEADNCLLYTSDAADEL